MTLSIAYVLLDVGMTVLLTWVICRRHEYRIQEYRSYRITI